MVKAEFYCNCNRRQTSLITGSQSIQAEKLIPLTAVTQEATCRVQLDFRAVLERDVQDLQESRSLSRQCQEVVVRPTGV